MRADHHQTHIELSLDVTDEAVDWIRTLLAATTYQGDVNVISYVPQAGKAASEWSFTVRLYLPNDGGVAAQVESIQKQLSALHRTGQTSDLQMAIVDQIPVLTTPTDSTSVHHVGQRFIILKPNSPYQPTENQIAIYLRSSLAFGSGLHPATNLILQLIEHYTTSGMQVLDLGSGSGILSVAMAKLGSQVLALDNDVVSVAATEEAIALNHVTIQVTARAGSLGAGNTLGHWMGGDVVHGADAADVTYQFDLTQQFDLIAANILARVHIAIAPDYQHALRLGGILLTAGFTEDYEPDLTAALEAAGFRRIDVAQTGVWMAIAYQLTTRPSSSPSPSAGRVA